MTEPRENVRAKDTVARLGGDEFALALPGLENSLDIDELMVRLLTALSSPYEVGARLITSASSIGLALYPNDGRDAATLLASADQAMYRSKQRGGATYCFYSGDDGHERVA